MNLIPSGPLLTDSKIKGYVLQEIYGMEALRAEIHAGKLSVTDRKKIRDGAYGAAAQRLLAEMKPQRRTGSRRAPGKVPTISIEALLAEFIGGSEEDPHAI